MADHYDEQRENYDRREEEYHKWCKTCGFSYRLRNQLERENSPLTKRWSWWIRRGWS